MGTRMLTGEELALRWHIIEPYVRKSLAYGLGDLTTYDIFIECQQFICQCWIREEEHGVINGVAITRLLTHKQYKEMVIVCTTSEGWFEHGPEILKMLEQFGRDMECKYASVYGRKGWVRALKDYGYEEPYTTLMKEL